MSGGERVGLSITLAVVFGVVWGLASGVLACGVFGLLVGAGLGAIIE